MDLFGCQGGRADPGGCMALTEARSSDTGANEDEELDRLVPLA